MKQVVFLEMFLDRR